MRRKPGIPGRISDTTMRNTIARLSRNGEAPYMQDFSESEQRAVDATAKNLPKYLLSIYIF
ncbi:MAG: hypothetical protein JXR76_18770 [Deltaproteobacteria bacterium]|nr:hypothetical protein [Deltaproteobacteria bacterium]